MKSQGIYLKIDESERLGFILSIITVVLFIIAISIFIGYGAKAPFYIVAVLAFIVGFLNAWVISRIKTPKETEDEEETRSSRKSTARQKRKKR
jgi:uncharacterized membrane protein